MAVAGLCTAVLDEADEFAVLLAERGAQLALSDIERDGVPVLGAEILLPDVLPLNGRKPHPEQPKHLAPLFCVQLGLGDVHTKQQVGVAGPVIG